MALLSFHPAIRAWFEETFREPTQAQIEAWPSIAAERHTLLAAPTGSGKTLAAFLSAIHALVDEAQRAPLPTQTRVLYVSPLKALSNDVQKNLEEPLRAIRKKLFELGFSDAPITTAVRSGDTPASERADMVKNPPHILVTTPESFYLLLTSQKGRQMLSTVRTVIVDEIHAVIGSKRGSHLALSLERLERLVSGPLTRVGLSATQKPMETVAKFLLGSSPRPCNILDVSKKRPVDLRLEVLPSPLEAVMSNEAWDEIYQRLCELIAQHKTTLIFTNTRRMAERIARKLSELVGEEDVTSHHGSLSKERRLRAEQRLKNGQLRALVATASLELGIDIGSVDLVCQIGSPRSISSLLQRAGRANHAVGGLPKARIFPLTRDELIECSALLDCVQRGELDQIVIPKNARDVLAQQIVAWASTEELEEDDVYRTVRGAYPFRDLSRQDFDAVISMLSDGFATKRGRRAAYLHRDAVHRKLRARKGARLTALTNGGAIPDTGDYQVILEPSGILVGTVNEDFAVESASGDIFQLGNSSWRVLRVDQGKVRVEDAHGLPPTIPFWIGEAPARSDELSVAFDRVRTAPDRESLIASGVPSEALDQMEDYLRASKASLGVMPSRETIVVERFFDEGGGMQLVLHSPFGNRVNRAWGLALRKRFCRTFNFELQAAATENAVVISLGPVHSFPLDDVFRFLHTNTVRDVLIQAMLDSPMFEVRWRWNANRALAVPRFYGGKKVPAPIQRMQAGDLLALVFPDQAACAENLQGRREIPDHPLVTETIEDCLHEAMDIEGLERILGQIQDGTIHTVARDVTEPSPLAQEILTARPYAFLDDAPLEERRTQAVYSRRWIDPKTASDLGALDGAAIDRVRDEAWPDPTDPDELHDALLWMGAMDPKEIPHASDFDVLVRDGRGTLGRTPDGATFCIATERVPLWKAVHPLIAFDPDVVVPSEFLKKSWTREEALIELVRGRLEATGPVTASTLARHFSCAESDVDVALLWLEKEGSILRGRFSPGVAHLEWCERRLLARIHRYTLTRLRAEIEPVTATDYLRFLFDWQHLTPATRVEGMAALPLILTQLEGYAAPSASWESEILPARVKKYDPLWLDALCLSGAFTWCRNFKNSTGTSPIRSTPILFSTRPHLRLWQNGEHIAPKLSSNAARILETLKIQGPSFSDELARETHLLSSQVEHALAELVAKGQVRSDAFAGLRKMIRKKTHRSLRSRSTLDDSGRWVKIHRETDESPQRIDEIAKIVLHRYGVVFRKMLEREDLPPWRDLVMAFRRMEARGEIRGGRFVAGFSGEQYALSEAVGALREVRRTPPEGVEVSISAADPLNLVGIVTPGSKVPALSKNRVLYRDGVPILSLEGGETKTRAPAMESGFHQHQWTLIQSASKRPSIDRRPKGTTR